MWITDRAGKLVNLDHVIDIDIVPAPDPLPPTWPVEATHQIIATGVGGQLYRLLIGPLELCQLRMTGIRRRLIAELRQLPRSPYVQGSIPESEPQQQPE